jgi:aminoglycoside phosphotransferase (APT) family kinase protein
MSSRTQVELTPDAVAELVRAGLGASARVLRAEPLAGGTFNTCWGVALGDGAELVLKVAPPPALPLLGYERDLLRTEADFYARAATAEIPVPRVVHADFGRGRIASDWLLMTRIPGRSLQSVRRRLARDELARVRIELGRAVARLARVRGEWFGYAPAELGTRAGSWREAYGAMLALLLRDAERWKVRLPRPAAAIEALVARVAPALDAVAAPSLVHFDLWDGNVFVEAGRLSGVIDGERAFGGDPLAELPSLALFGDIERDADFLRGFAEENGRALVFDPPTRARVALAALYLHLIMWIEPPSRGARGLVPFVVRRLVARALRRDFAALEALAAGGGLT